MPFTAGSLPRILLWVSVSLGLASSRETKPLTASGITKRLSDRDFGKNKLCCDRVSNLSRRHLSRVPAHCQDSCLRRPVFVPGPVQGRELGLCGHACARHTCRKPRVVKPQTPAEASHPSAFTTCLRFSYRGNRSFAGDDSQRVKPRSWGLQTPHPNSNCLVRPSASLLHAWGV